MSSLIHVVFGTELTCISNEMEKLLGSNFNNALCNGVTWFVFFWIILHFSYDKLINFYLKQIGFPQYLRTRLSDSLWLLAFYITFFVYYLITINEYNILDIMNYKRTIIIYYEIISTRKMIAQALLCSFYLHMAYRDGIQMGSFHALFKFVALTVVCTTSYILKFLEIPFTITALVAISGIFQEIAKMFYSLLNRESSFCSVFIGTLYVFSVILFSAVYFTIIPLSYLIPLGMKLFGREGNPLTTVLFFSLLCWLNLVIYKSIFLNAMFHWLYHIKKPNKDEDEEDENLKYAIQLECLGNIVECSLFPPRTDDSFMIAFMRSETKKRQRKMIAKRKPKGQAKIMQTLKCIMAIKRKLSGRKSNGASDKQEEPSLICEIIEEKESTQEDETNKVEEMSKLSSSEVILKVEKLYEKDNIEEEETELNIIERRSKSDISIDEENSKENITEITKDDKLENKGESDKETDHEEHIDNKEKLGNTMETKHLKYVDNSGSSKYPFNEVVTDLNINLEVAGSEKVLECPIENECSSKFTEKFNKNSYNKENGNGQEEKN